MRPVGHRIVSRHLPALLVVIAVCSCWMMGSSNGQQQYDNTIGYFCSNSGKKSCNTFIIYRARSDYSTVPQIAKLFNTNATRVARLNKLTSKQTLETGKAVIVPITCLCGANSTSYANVSYTIVQGDTFSDLNAAAFESLSTVTQVLAVNSELDANDLPIGQKIVFPVRCACPSTAQISNGVKSLVTYPVGKLDYVDIIASSFGVEAADIINANTLTGPNTQIDYQTTLVIPINTNQPNYTYVAPAPGSAPTPESQTSPSQAPAPSASGHHSSSNKTGVYVAVAVGVCAAILILAGLGLCLLLALRRKRRKRKDGFQSPLVQRSDGGLGGSSSAGGVSSFSDLPSKRRSLGADTLVGIVDILGSDKPALFTYEELCNATNNFSDSSRVHGTVYRGLLNGKVVAIKQTKGNPLQELKILCRIHHTNVVKLVGLCSSAAAEHMEHLYLVCEYAENGSLNDALHTDYHSSSRNEEAQSGSSQSSSFLSWTMRVQVALDAASGLEYIHDYVNPSYVHKDVKSSNILLDGAFRAKIANFGMARSGGSGANADLMMTRHIVGSYGYMAPEYLAHGLVTTKADVFSFGVVLLELLSGSEAILEDGDGEERYLYTSITPVLESADPAGSLKNWMDPALQDSYPMDTALSMASMARSCLDMDPAQRPNMKDITFSLSKLLNASLEWESSSAYANALARAPIEAR